MDAYEILGVTRSTSLEKVRKQFKKLAMDVHPDKGGSDHLFQILKKSYVQVLQDIKNRESDKQFHELKNEHEQYKHENSYRVNVKLANVDETEMMKRFHKVFEENKMKDEHSKGYGKKMVKQGGPREEINVQKTMKKFSLNKFNQEFNKKEPTNTKHLVKKYNPEPFVLSKTLPYTELGIDKVGDFSNHTESKNGLQYTDYMKAHTTNRLSEGSSTHIPKYKTIDDVERDRSNISFQMDEEELKKYTAFKMKQERKEKNRMKILESKDQQISNLYEKVNKSMLQYKQ
jgi:hypothetical protein